MVDNPSSCKLKIPKDLNGKNPAFLVDFSNGNLNLHQSKKMKFTCYRRIDDRKKMRTSRILIANNGNLNYKGMSFESNNYLKEYNYYVGVRNKSTGRMKIFDAINFHLKPVLNEHVLKTGNAVSSETKNYRERTEDLDMNFGSKEKKRSLVARQKYSRESTSLDNALEGISLNNSVDELNKSIPLSPAANAIDYLPPQNCDAPSVDQVYKISDIISEGEIEELDERATELLQDLPSDLPRWKIDGTYCEYVTSHLDNTNIEFVKVKYLIYFNYLSSFSKLLSNDMKKKDPVPHFAEPFKSCLLDRFTCTSVGSNGRIARTFPLKMKDKLLAYMLVLALIIDEYSVNLALVQKGTKYGLPKIQNIAQALGCYIHRSTIDHCVVSVAQLKLPLYVLQKHKKG